MNTARSATAWVSTVAAAALFATPAAYADDRLSDSEEALGDAMSDVVCIYFDDNGMNSASANHVFNIITRQQEVDSPGDAVDVLNYMVREYCPSYWPALAEIEGDS